MKPRLAIEDGPATIGVRHPADTIEAPLVRRLVELVKQLPDIRAGKVRQMRRLIALGRLDTPERINATVRRIAEELGL